MNTIELNETVWFVFLILGIIGGVTVFFVALWLISWPFWTIKGIDNGQDYILDDLKKIKEKLNIKEDEN